MTIAVRRLYNVQPHTDTFADADLSAGVLTLTHGLDQTPVVVSVYDSDSQHVMPNEVTIVDSNTVTIDLSSWGTIVGDWSVAVR